MSPPEAPEVREAWRRALDEHLARKERIRALRDELAACRTAGKARRHAERSRRIGATTQDGDTST